MFRLLNKNSVHRLTSSATNTTTTSAANKSRLVTSRAIPSNPQLFASSSMKLKGQSDSASAKSVPEEYVSLEEEQARARRVIENIAKYKASIEENTQKGN